MGNLKPWIPGTSGNPLGARAYHNRRRAAREISTECLGRISEILFDGGPDELYALINDPTVTTIEKMFAGVVVKAFEKGDAQGLVMLLDRFSEGTRACFHDNCNFYGGSSPGNLVSQINRFPKNSNH